jgi:hypothetical protein
MKNLTAKFALLAGRSDTRAIIILVTMALYIISAGAPDAGGGIGLR